MSGKKLKTRRPKPAVAKRPILKHGGKKIEIPVLTGPVGPSVPELTTKYRTWNAPNDVRIVEYYLSLLAHINHLDTNCGLIDKSGPDLGKARQAAACWNLNLNQTIKNFQKMCTLEIHNADEVKYGIILPDGPTLVQLVDLGDCVEQLEELENAKTNPKKYIYHGLIDANTFIQIYHDKFSKDERKKVHPKYDVNLRQFLGFLGCDPFMIDIRWMAYILATVFHECARPDGGWWRVRWRPVEELLDEDNPKNYFSPVKVKKLADGTARITEIDGDQWNVDHNGLHKRIGQKKHPKPGAISGTFPSAIYNNDDGMEHTYFGRGYAQLTWWNNYALTSVQIDKGLNLLFEPEKALDPATSYTILSYCLRTGNGFANHHKLSDYMYGSKCDFKGARHMVNGHDNAGEIAINAKNYLFILNALLNPKK